MTRPSGGLNNVPMPRITWNLVVRVTIAVVVAVIAAQAMR
jgi:preprotein translocase subunit Sec61beta